MSDEPQFIIPIGKIKFTIDGGVTWHELSSEFDENIFDCQDEQPPYAETPEQADEILDRWING